MHIIDWILIYFKIISLLWIIFKKIVIAFHLIFFFWLLWKRRNWFYDDIYEYDNNFTYFFGRVCFLGYFIKEKIFIFEKFLNWVVYVMNYIYGSLLNLICFVISIIITQLKNLYTIIIKNAPKVIKWYQRWNKFDLIVYGIGNILAIFVVILSPLWYFLYQIFIKVQGHIIFNFIIINLKKLKIINMFIKNFNKKKKKFFFFLSIIIIILVFCLCLKFSIYLINDIIIFIKNTIKQVQFIYNDLYGTLRTLFVHIKFWLVQKYYTIYYFIISIWQSR